MIEIDTGRSEHAASALSVGSSNDGRMKVNKPVFLKKFVDGAAESIPYSEDRAEGVAAGPQMLDLAQELHRMAFFLQRVRGRIGGTKDLQFVSVQLNRLTRAHRLHEFARSPKRSAGRNLRHEFAGNSPLFYDYL